MVLLIIFAVIVVLAGLITWFATEDDWYSDQWFNAVFAVMISGMILGFIFLIIQLAGTQGNTETTNVSYDQKLVSLNDGTGVSGTFRGGLFIARGQINDTQHFSYYRYNQDGSFALDKRSASQSTIFTDSTQENAFVQITDSVTNSKCKPSWWILGCPTNPIKQEFVHANFHIPADSIVNDFVLDAK